MSSAEGEFYVSDTETAAKYFINFLKALYAHHTVL